MNYLQQSVEGKVQENGIPFSMKLDTVPENKGIKAMKAASFIAIENGISEMTLDEINAEIAEVLAAGENRHFESSENRHFQFN
ncbi:MAG: hypothetical protein ILP14_12850 [Oscillospiraceae bacterium]|nr:hypothetical protein [Oscillospiraceae bacterium]